jgi:hypothetical protein
MALRSITARCRNDSFFFDGAELSERGDVELGVAFPEPGLVEVDDAALDRPDPGLSGELARGDTADVLDREVGVAGAAEPARGERADELGRDLPEPGLFPDEGLEELVPRRRIKVM